MKSSAINLEPIANLLQDRGFLASDLLEALPVAVYLTDAAGCLTFYNRAAADLWGWCPIWSSTKWCGSWRLFCPDGAPLPHDQCPMAVAIKQNRQVRGAEALMERPDGTRVPFAPFPTPLRGSGGELTGAVNLLLKISECRSGETVLRRRRPNSQFLRKETERRASNLLMAILPIAGTIHRYEAVQCHRRTDGAPALALALALRIMDDSGFGDRTTVAPDDHGIVTLVSQGAAQVLLGARRDARSSAAGNPPPPWF